MIRKEDIANGLTGALRLAGRDTSGYTCFDTSVEGFWRSFTAALVSIPGYLAVASSHPEGIALEAGAYLLVEAIAYVIGWFAFPVAMLHVAEVIDRRERYITFIVAANWATAIQISLLGLIAGLQGMGVFPENLGGFFSLVATLWILSYQWFVARTALDVSGPVAAGIVLLDLVIGLMITGVTAAIET